MTEVFINRANLFLGTVAAVLTMLLGDYWMFFMAFAALNVADYLTGFMKARYTKTESSSKGALGIFKKVGYWVVIAIAFFVSVSCSELGKLIGFNLDFLSFVGYFTLATYIVNEIRSIIENLVVCNVHIPEFLTKGLAITDKLMKDTANLRINNNNTKKEE